MQQAQVTPGIDEHADAAARSVWRLRIVAVCVGLTALAFLQDPGLTAVDTKIDLAVDPGGWLGRALHVWDPSGTFGQLQNQAYGYLWPMGSFFLAGKLLAVPAWVIQRLWWALVMSVAFTGVFTLAGRLRIGTPWTRLIAGIAFALSPRMITEMGGISVEAWPSALAPWVLVPLIGLAPGTPLRRPLTCSALVVACAGGVNATAVLAVVPLAMMWLTGLHPVRLRLRATGLWCLAVGCATAWWVIPLLLLGRYSPPFLDYIETAAVTTAPTDMTTVLRGTSHWLAYLTDAFGPTWGAGWRLATEAPLIVATLVAAGLGLAGLARRGMPHRRYLVTGLLVGLALVGLGHIGDVPGLFADSQRAFLDSAGAPLRNVHKFDVVLRLPLVLGLAHLLAVYTRAAAVVPAPAPAPPAAPRSVVPAYLQVQPVRLRALAVTGVAVAAIAGIAAPALAGGLAPAGSFRGVPGYWQEAASWLDEHLDDESVLVVPAARFPRYAWGSPTDEMVQPLLTGRWALRNAIPLTPPATVRLLDAVEGALSTGAGSAGLADLLARSGVRYVLLRSDLDYGHSETTQPVVVRQALARSPGVELATGFGPAVGGDFLPRNVVDHGMDVAVRALEVYEVERSVRPVVAHDAGSLTTVVGGPESLLSMAGSGRLTAGPTVLAGDRPADLPAGPVVLTDGMRRREVAFGRLHDAGSATMQAGEKGVLGAPARDYLPDWGDRYDTVVRYRGIRSVTASSSYAEALPLNGSRPAYQPYAAVDGDFGTSWRSAPGLPAEGQWLQIDLDEPQVVRQVRLTVDLGTDAVPARITVLAGRGRAVVENFAQTVTVGIDSQFLTRTVRIRIDRVLYAPRLGAGGVGILEVAIPGVKAERTLVVPPSPVPDRPASVLLTTAPSVPACYFDVVRPVCSPAALRASEDADRIERTVPLPAAARYDMRLVATPRSGAALNALLDPGGAASIAQGLAPSVTASSSGVPDPVARPGTAADGDPSTIWYAADSDTHPWLRLSWLSPRTVSGVRLTLPANAAASRPWEVTVIGDDGLRSGTLDLSGTLKFDPPMRTDGITILITATIESRSYDPYRRTIQSLPVGVGEATALYDPLVQRADLERKLTLRCGTGPTVAVGAVVRSTALVASRRDLLELREVEARPCGTGATAPIAARVGDARIAVAPSTVAKPARLSLTPRAGTAAGAGAGAPLDSAAAVETPVRVDAWSPSLRRVHLGAYPNQRVLSVRENVNTGWRASVLGKQLTSITIDGWQQGWIVPAGAQGEVVLRFTPDRAYGAAISGGALLLAGVAVAAVLPAGRVPAPAAPVPAAPAPTAPVPAGPAPTAVPAGASVAAVRRRRRWVLPVVIGGLALLAVGGTAAVGLTLLGAAVVVVIRALQPNLGADDRRLLRRLSLAGVRWLPVVCFALAGWLTVTGQEGHTAALPQLAAVGAMTALWVPVAFGRRRGH